MVFALPRGKDMPIDYPRQSLTTTIALSMVIGYIGTLRGAMAFMSHPPCI